MVLYNESLYGESLYNTETVPKLFVPKPKDARAYLGTSNNAYVFMWTIDCCANNCGGGLSFVPLDQYDFELCIDTSSSFDSPNLRCFTDRDAITGFGIGGFGEDGFGIGGFAGGYRGLINFSKGQLVRSYEVLFPIRAEGEEITYYWRVRVLSTNLESEYSDTYTFNRDLSNKNQIHGRMFENYPDENVYEKDSESTLIYTIAKEHGRQVEEMDFESKRTKRDIYLKDVRDEKLYDNHAVLYNFKNTGQTLQEYREQFIKVKEAFKYSGTAGAIERLIRIFYCTDPLIQEVKDLTGWRIFDPSDPELNRPHYYIKDSVNLVSPVIVIYSKAEKAHAFYLTILNSFNLTVDQSYVRDLLLQLIPADAKALIIFQ